MESENGFERNVRPGNANAIRWQHDALEMAKVALLRQVLDASRVSL